MCGKTRIRLFQSIVVLSAFVVPGAVCYRHVIFMHGILGGKHEVEHFEAFLNKYHPGTNITFIDKFKYLASFEPLWKQVDEVRQRMAQIMSEHPDGVHFICFSQGGLICRGVLETLPSHNVVNFISLSSPQGGQFGTTQYLAPILPQYLTKDFYKFFYSTIGQKFSIGNYWNDPHQQPLYAKWSNYLAVINNQSTSNKSFTPGFRDNFLRLRNLVLIGGPDDGVITPWQSSQFAVFDENENVIEMKQQRLYENDWFGLRTLDKSSRLHLHSVAGVTHTHWHRNLTVFLNYIEPWLD